VGLPRTQERLADFNTLARRPVTAALRDPDSGAGDHDGAVDLPATTAQLLLALLFVVPGSVYQAARSRLRGPTPDDSNVSMRVLRALAVSAFLDAVYIAVLGPTLVRLFGAQQGKPSASGFADHPRQAGLLGLLLLFVIPVSLAGLDYLRVRRGWGLRLSYDPTPRAWDFAFREIEPTYVRLLTTDGVWLGGWYGENSFVSSFPEPREVFIETAHLMEPDGSFGAEVPGSNGLYVRCDDIRAIEFVDG
jgi:hypothetical protein